MRVTRPLTTAHTIGNTEVRGAVHHPTGGCGRGVWRSLVWSPARRRRPGARGRAASVERRPTRSTAALRAAMARATETPALTFGTRYTFAIGHPKCRRQRGWARKLRVFRPPLSSAVTDCPRSAGNRCRSSPGAAECFMQRKATQCREQGGAVDKQMRKTSPPRVEPEWRRHGGLAHGHAGACGVDQADGFVG